MMPEKEKKPPQPFPQTPLNLHPCFWETSEGCCAQKGVPVQELSPGERMTARQPSLLQNLMLIEVSCLD